MKTLALDTSGSQQSVAILQDGELLHEIRLDSPSSHTVNLLSSVQSALQHSSTDLSGIDLYAVTVGPGSFTGIRIGLSTIKGLCRVVPRPTAGVSSLLALAFPILTEDRWVIPCLDARLGEIYTAAYRRLPGGAGLEEAWKSQAMPVVQLLEKANHLSGGKLMVGSGIEAFPNLLTGVSGAETLREKRAHHICAGSVARLGEAMFRRKEVIPGKRLEPAYLRVSEAERRRRRSA